jgi:hypothetical protein
MRNKKVISYSNLPTKLPLTITIAIAVALDYYNAPNLLKVILYSYMTIIWIYNIIKIVKEKEVDLFKKKKTSKSENKIIEEENKTN